MNPDCNELLLKFKDSFRSFSTDFAYNAVGGDNLYIESYEGNKIVLVAPEDSQKTIINNNYMDDFINIFKNITSKDVEIKVISNKEVPEYRKHREQIKQIEKANTNPLINPAYTFDTFVVGDNNKIAYTAAKTVAERSNVFSNPIFIYGGPGLGKTHLMQAIANEVYRTQPNLKVLYVTSENFLIELVNSIKNKERDTEEFRQKYRNVDVLLMDDVQFLSGKEAAQQELFNTFNQLHQSGKRIILSADKPPKDIPVLEERLKSRFNQGLIVDISSPDYETRLAILKQKAEEKNIIVPDKILQRIAEKLDTNIRDLEGALNKITMIAMLEGSISMEVTEKAINEIALENENIITPDTILDVVSSYFNVPKKDIMSSKKSKEIAFPRQIAMYFCRTKLSLPYKRIGDYFGKKDHTTIMHAEQKIINEMQTNRNTKLIVESVDNFLNAKNADI